MAASPAMTSAPPLTFDSIRARPVLLKLQRPGRAAQSADAFLRGFVLPAGTVLPPPAVLSLPA